MSYIIRFPMNAERYVPKVQVSFHTEDQCYQATGELVGLDGALDPTNQVLSINTQKTMDAPVGAFTIQLAGLDWVSKLKSNDIVVVSMGYKGEAKLATAFVGLIDTVRRTRVMGDGKPQVGTTVTGRDFGKLLIKSMLRFYPSLGQYAGENAHKFFLTEEGWVTLMSYFLNENAIEGTPAVILDTIMRHILQKVNDVSWTVYDEANGSPKPKKVKLGNVLRYNFGKVNMFLPMILTADQFEGPIWNLMEWASIKPFTELFVDVREDTEAWNPGDKPRVVNETIEQSSSPDKATIGGGDIMKGAYPSPRHSFGQDNSADMVVLRNTPFDKELWNKLYTHDLPAEDVLEEDLSKSDNEHYNLFWAGTTINPLGFDLKHVAPPLFNEADAKRYGVSPLEVQIEGLAIKQENQSEHSVFLTEVSKNFSAKLKAWFEKNHEYFTGSMTVRGKGSYKIGQKLRREGLGLEFYIEGVTQNFNVFTSWTTTLELTRGMAIGSAPDHTAYLPKDETVPARPTSEKTVEEVKNEYYTVQAGDSLWSIAGKKEIYGNNSEWTKIWEANKDMLIQRDSRNNKDLGKWLYAGQRLRIPRK